MKKAHLVHENDQWKFRMEEAERAIKNFDTKDDAMKFSTDYMRDHGGSLKIHKQNGVIQEERTYPRSADPTESKG